MDKLSAKQILQSRDVISTTGKYTVKVTSVTHNHQRDNGQTVNIVNFAAMTAFQKEQAVKAYKAGDFEEATRKALSSSVLDRQYTPVKGEIVDIEVGEIYSDNAKANVLVVNSIIPRQATKATKFSFDFDEEEVEEEVEAGAAAASAPLV